MSDVGIRYLLYHLHRLWGGSAYAAARPRVYVYLGRPNPVQARVLVGWGVVPLFSDDADIGEGLRKLLARLAAAKEGRTRRRRRVGSDPASAPPAGPGRAGCIVRTTPEDAAVTAPPPPARAAATATEIAPDLACVAQSIVNLYLAGPPGAGDRGWVLIDAGLFGSAGKIARAAAARFGPGARPAAIVLTHGHFDHVGALPELADRWGAPVYAHEWELPYLTGRSAYPPPDPAVGGGAMSFLSRLFPSRPIDLGNRVHALPADGSVPGLPGWRWVHTPGHAPGHVSLFRDADRVLVAGNAFVTQRQESALAVLTRPAEVRRPPAYFTCDWEGARRSVERLAALRPEVAATGHGVPMAGDELRAGLDALLRDWNRVALPAHGRYVRAPALVGPDGVHAVPPPVVDRQLVALAGAGLAVGLGVALVRRNRPDT